MQLRKVCNHPYLFEGVEPEGADEFGEHLVEASGKLTLVDRLLKRILPKKEQVLIFSCFTQTLNIIEDFCAMREINYCRLDGSTSLEDREEYIEEFTKENSEYQLFLISTRAGGLGINLMSANHVIIYDSDWNPQVDLQAMDRAHRIG
jgi:SWI/SNF-related matrix-associated actin-dependent regulator of chromatin subfamily A member 5